MKVTINVTSFLYLSTIMQMVISFFISNLNQSKLNRNFNINPLRIYTLFCRQKTLNVLSSFRNIFLLKAQPGLLKGIV